VALLLPTATAWGWWVKGHEAIARAADTPLPAEMPEFFRTPAAAEVLAHLAGDPDRWKNKDTAFLRAAESPDHYIDLEDLQGNELPVDRYKATALLSELGQRPERTGMLPYAIMEHFDRLTIAFYDYRQEAPDKKSEATRMKCLIYAGVLCHYTGDAAMPLHTTRDYDGRKGPDGQLKQRGIHARIDGFPEKQGLTAEEISRGLEPREIPDVWTHVRKVIRESHQFVDQCYELDAAGAFVKPTDKSRVFIMERCRAGAQFTMDLYYTAWKKSAQLRPPY
jgi:hypothetical protein